MSLQVFSATPAQVPGIVYKLTQTSLGGAGGTGPLMPAITNGDSNGTVFRIFMRVTGGQGGGDSVVLSMSATDEANNVHTISTKVVGPDECDYVSGTLYARNNTPLTFGIEPAPGGTILYFMNYTVIVETL